jgi:hypothetical protein
MNHYKADLGRWEKGISVEFEAEDQVAAMKIARDSLDKYIADGSCEPDAMVVKLVEDGYCIYDYLNGFYRK